MQRFLAENNNAFQPAGSSSTDNIAGSSSSSADHLGGSTGGYTRMALYDWDPPDVTEFDVVDPNDV